jgi:hypothetical protein
MSSYANLPADRVMTACQNYIAARTARVLREREVFIAERVGQPTWFGLGKPKTREEVEAESIDDLDYIEITGGYWFNKARHLLDLAIIANLTGDKVTVDAELASFLKNHFE